MRFEVRRRVCAPEKEAASRQAGRQAGIVCNFEREREREARSFAGPNIEQLLQQQLIKKPIAPNFFKPPKSFLQSSALDSASFR